jgi:hypothetical protein
MLPERICQLVSGIDPRGLLTDPATPELVERLEDLATAVETIAVIERGSVINTWRLRAGQLRLILLRQSPPAQARLIEDHPDSGAYGPAGRRR